MSEVWYYDACALDSSKNTYAEIINKNNKHLSVVSHLSLGEAYGNSHLKSKEVVASFVGLIDKLSDYLTIVSNDGIDNIFHQIRDKFSRLSITDAMHVATAIANGCVILRTTDRDLTGMDKKKLSDIAKDFHLDRFSVTEVQEKKW